MLNTVDFLRQHEGDHWGRVVAIVIAALILVRLGVAACAPLAFDEAYYWLWSKNLAGGYYDHPPLVAFVIRLGTIIAGDTQLGVRLISVLSAVPASWAVWRAAAILFADARVAATAALFFNLTLIVAVGTIIVTPDAPLLVASALLLFFLAKVWETGRGAWWLAVGAAAGAALLSKYSALFLGAGIVAWLVLVPEMRRWLRSPWLWLGGGVAVAVFAPVLLWNAEHQWVSFIKQFGRAGVADWNLRFLGEHIGAQFGLATPAVFVLGALGITAFLSSRGGPAAPRVLIGAMFWPLTIYFVWHAMHARVEGNWTAPVFPAFAIAAAVAAHAVPWTGLTRRVAEFSRVTAAPVGIAIAALIYGQALFGLVPIGTADPTARQLGAGWSRLGVEIDKVRRDVGAVGVLTTSYATTGWLSFYLPTRPPVVQLNQGIRWVNAPEPPPALFQQPWLYVCSPCAGNIDLVRSLYRKVEPIAEMSRTRRNVVIETYGVYRVEGPIGEPLDRSPPPELQRR